MFSTVISECLDSLIADKSQINRRFSIKVNAFLYPRRILVEI